MELSGVGDGLKIEVRERTRMISRFGGMMVSVVIIGILRIKQVLDLLFGVD